MDFIIWVWMRDLMREIGAYLEFVAIARDEYDAPDFERTLP